MILDCLQSKRYCKAIMNDLLLFTPSKRSHIDKLEDLLKELLKIDYKFLLGNVNCSEQISNICVIKYSFRTKEFA